MRITSDFSALWRVVEELGAVPQAFILERDSSISEIELELIRGREVRLDELEVVSGLLVFQGRQILLYIPDQGQAIHEVLAGDRDRGKKFHVAYCSVLENMRNAGRFQRYIATTDISGTFELVGIADTREEIRGSGHLYVCQNCLKFLNYKQARVKNNARTIRETFDLGSFFETYSSCFRYLPARTAVSKGEYSYPEGWSTISNEVREDAYWRCNDCRVNLVGHKNLLHVHHVDGVKSNNQRSNLQPLCKACHRLQPLHDHLYVPREEMKLINSLRNAEGLFNNGWAAVLKYADPACHGVLGLAKAAGWPSPKIEFVIPPGEVAMEVAWPSHKVAVALGANPPAAVGWRVLDLAAAANFDFAQ